MSNHANFSPCRYEVNKKPISNEKLQNQRISSKIILESIFKRFRKSAI